VPDDILMTISETVHIHGCYPVQPA
jgi:hypothetical protein